MANFDTEDEDISLFRELMKDVKPLGDKSKALEDRLLMPIIEADDEDSGFAQDEFFSGHDVEPISGDTKLAHFNSDMRPNDKRKLLQGKFKVQDSLDLHGLTAQEAAEDVSEFLADTYGDGLKCISIIHGRGRLTGTAILKSHVNIWLQPSRYVLAFCSCLPKHGGTGAVYVLLSS